MRKKRAGEGGRRGGVGAGAEVGEIDEAGGKDRDRSTRNIASLDVGGRPANHPGVRKRI